jgi:ribosomal protein S12 methylthiotransferase
MAEGKILPYLDVPFQHASPRILKAMKRPASSENNLERIRRWREICPDLTIRSTFITGFPGETDADFEELLQFLEEAKLDRVGAFAYSPVEGAAANELPGAVPEEIREERRIQLMEFQEDISTERLERFIGREMTVLVDEIDEEGALARSPATPRHRRPRHHPRRRTPRARRIRPRPHHRLRRPRPLRRAAL